MIDQDTLIKQNLQPLRVDSMPYEVATEYLTTPGHKMSGTFRRECQRARASYYVSTNVPKYLENRLDTKFRDWRIDKLVRQQGRIKKRIKIVQTKINKVKVNDIRENMINGLLMPLFAFSNAIQAELGRRHSATVSCRKKFFDKAQSNA
jgi:hypothetical protein